MVAPLEIDVNIDIGESEVFDEKQNYLLLRHVSSCNIACGGHAGNREVMRSIVRLAVQLGLRIGAHPSYPDKSNFGRVRMNLDDKAFEGQMKNQIKLLLDIAKQEQTEVSYVKPHGALYNEIAKGKNEAERFLDCLQTFQLPLMCLASSPIEPLCEKRSIEFIPEAFIDRKYQKQNELSPRSVQGALITNPQEAYNQFIRLIKHRNLRLISGALKKCEADSYCIHGDNPASKEILNLVKKKTRSENFKIVKYFGLEN